jgi:hypothetical protein
VGREEIGNGRRGKVGGMSDASGQGKVMRIGVQCVEKYGE